MSRRRRPRLISALMSPFLTLFLIALAVSAGYAGGRLHQWYRHALERDNAWRDGYDQASGTLFKVAARVARRRVGEQTGDVARSRGEGTVTDISKASSAGRHSFEARHEVTHRLPSLRRQAG
jgi:hypothetical protein